jgi:hypothetical protein
MTRHDMPCALLIARAFRACLAAYCLTGAPAYGDERDEGLAGVDSPFPSSQSLAEELPPGGDDASAAKFLDPAAADFGEWKPIVDDLGSPDREEDELRPFDWLRHWGLRHSSTDGRFVDKSVPLQYSSWLNRPYHVDWFAGPLLSDNPASGRVSQSNELFGGLRAGWDFDYYWGAHWRFGWSDPELFVDGTSDVFSGSYFVTDVDLVYYPWGDTRVRPYFQVGMGMTQIGTVREDGSGQEATLLGMPFGAGLQFRQTPWLAWRLELVDNLAFGADGVDTMNNVAFTAGMDLRLGARPSSYWPWRSSRRIW